MNDDTRRPPPEWKESEARAQQPQPLGPYLDRLPEEERPELAGISGDIDLEQEIRLLRVILAILVPEIPASIPSITRVSTALMRAIYLQARQRGGGTDIERDLQAAAEEILRSEEGDYAAS